ncbi:PAS domain-containing response regulator [Mongoliitalea daihaiensis]|uniref:PAS domain-containing response regulator n=1 Tax=Mongoliitalea daihaiensis TaxID=2782006 RepID=UPI001F30649C|nr:response regulator [Mongoliitalea daihaiensis]UJP64528.1 response regulator [Mongoliitalea daihaiensis]
MLKDSKEYKILVVDDNKGDRVLIEAYLEDTVLLPKISEAESYKAAKKILENSSLLFDVILLDLGLPDLSGEELIKSMIKLFPKTPIIVLTGYPDVDFSRKSLKLGVSDYLLKDELNSPSLYKSIVYSIERKKATNQLIRSEKRYRDLFQLSPMPIWVFEEQTLRFLAVNNATIQTYGYSNEEFMDMKITQIKHQDDIPLLETALKASKKSTRMNLSGVFKHKKKNGELMEVEVYTNDIEFNGKSAKIVLINDITFKARYIEAIETQNEKLKEIAWIQSHVVRAPLSRMMGLIGLLELEEESDNLSADQKELVQFIKDSAGELDGIIREITIKTEQIKID